MPGRQRVADHGHSRKYWTQVPNLLDDSDLSPYARTVYLHYLRISGRQETCEETVRETAAHCRMSRSSVVNARVELVDNAWIEVEELGSHGRGADQLIHLLDRWDENMAHFGKQGQPENGIVHMVDNSPEAEEPPENTGIDHMVDIPAGPVDNSVQPVDIPAGPVDNSNSPSLLTGEERKTLKKGEEARARGSPQSRGDHCVLPEPCPKPVPDVSRYDQVLARIRAGDPDLAVGGSRERNERAINESPAPVAMIAEAYLALMAGRWKDAFVQKQGSLWAVVENLGGYQVTVVRGFGPPGRRNGAAKAELETFSSGVLV